MALPEIRLLDGRVARFVRRPTVGDASRAIRIAGAKGNEIDRNAALLSQIVEIDGQRQVMEDVFKLDLDDFTEMNGIMQEGRWDVPAAPDGVQEENFTPAKATP